MFWLDGIRAISLQNKANRRPDVILEVFCLLLEQVIALHDLSRGELHQCASVKLLHLLSFWLVDSKQVNKVALVFSDVVEDILVEEELAVQFLFVVAAEFDDGVDRVFNVACL